MNMTKRSVSLKLILHFFTILSLIAMRDSAAASERKFDFNIPSAEAKHALEIIAKQTGSNLLYPPEKLSNLQTNSLRGSFTLPEALKVLLDGTSIEALITPKGVIIIHDKSNDETSKLNVDQNKIFQPDDENVNNKHTKGDIESIVVTGFRQSLNKALSYKRTANNQIDVISAEDIGKLPDVEIGDVLERIAGVQVSRGDDGVVNGTSIRGLPGYFNRTLYNGHILSTSLSTERFFDSQIMPAAFVRRVEVHKTPVADVIEGGLAGEINLKSIRAFDVGEQALRFKFTGSTTSNSNENNSDVTAIFSDLYLEETLGFSSGVSFLKTDTENQKGLVFNPVFKMEEGVNKDYNGDGDISNNDTFYLPSTIAYSLSQNIRERNALFANFEWRPEGRFTMFAEVFYSQYNTINIRDNLRFKPSQTDNSEGSGAQTTSYEGPFYNEERQYLTIYHPSNIFAEVSNRHNKRDSDTIMAFIETQWFFESWSLNLAINASKSKTKQFTVEAKNLSANNYFDVILDGTDLDSPWEVYFHNPPSDPDYSQRGLLNDSQAPYRALTVNGLQLGAEYESNSWGVDFESEYVFPQTNSPLVLSTIQMGLHYREDESLANKPSANFAGRTDELFNGGEITYRQVEPEKGQWFDGKDSQRGAPLPWVVPDIDSMINIYNWTDESVRSAAIAINRYQPGIRDDLKEDITAAFTRLNFESEEGKFSGNFGLRYAKTQQFASGQGANIEEGLVDQGSGNPYDPDYISLLVLPVDNYMTRKRSYHTFLPSMNLKYLLFDDTILRLGWSETMTRPLRGDLKVLDRYNRNTNTINFSNQEIKPFFSENVDLSLEWYFADESAFMLSLFYKDIKNLTYVHAYQKTLPVKHLETGLTLDDVVVNMNEKKNGDGAIFQGGTLMYQQPFTSLPSFLADTGIKAHYTYLDNSRPDLLANVSKENVSVVLYYDTDYFDARLNYTYRSESVKSISTPTVPAQYFNPSTTVNASVSFLPSKYLNISFGIHNITEEVNSDYYASGVNNNFSDYGRVYSLTFTAKL
ncbi:TonB-dependent receptor [Thalassotalea fonticola]|uniref:TonB-dependent receptor n=1 Tax=Thalassotalea fonticola TaxID=3065649 RepID=A0ABZ0GSR2_9GAMM|nr:TonB-dependent receptor [Colwelliaceae bacterium S1-1]